VIFIVVVDQYSKCHRGQGVQEPKPNTYRILFRSVFRETKITLKVSSLNIVVKAHCSLSTHWQNVITATVILILSLTTPPTLKKNSNWKHSLELFRRHKKKENRNRQRGYTKQSKDTLRHCRQVCIKLASKGFLPVDKYMRLKRVPTERDKPTPEADMGDQSTVLEEGSIIDNIQEESEEGSDQVDGW
jgi:hypothetical protein